MKSLMNRLSEREKKILYVVIALFVIMVGYHGIWRPALAKFRNLDDQIFSMQLKMRKAKVFLRQRNDIIKETERYPNLQQGNAGSDEEEIARLLNFIEQTARQSGVSLSDVKPGAVQSDKWTKRYVVELNANSNLRQLLEFVYTLQYSPELLKIDRIDISTKEDNPAALQSYLIVTRVVVQ